jgi:iron complex transport system substrate-binding protein
VSALRIASGALLLLVGVACTAVGAPPAGQSAPAAHLPITLADATGAQVTVTSTDRIVSLSADVTEIVFALGLGDRLVGVSDAASVFPPAAKDLPKVSTGHTLSAEGILSLKPTVVVGLETAGPPAVPEQVRGTGVSLVLAPAPTTLEAPALKLRMLGQALGVPEQGERLAREYERDLEQARTNVNAASARPRVLFLYVRGASGTQLAAGKSTSIDPILEAAGAINAGAEAGITGYQPFTPEAAIAARPDALLLLSEGLKSVGGVDGLLQLPGLRETPAGQAKRVLDMDDLYLLGMGPRTGKAILELQTALHGQR